MKRTATCGALRKQDIGKEVILNGWVHRHRDHGGILFIDLRDRYGITQVVIEPDSLQELKDTALECKFEYCIAVKGMVRARPQQMLNPQLATGEIEVKALSIEILNRAPVLPFMIEEKIQAKEDIRFKYRYLDLRSSAMQRNLYLRHRVSFATRQYLNNLGFYEIETPTLIKSTPEGARDFIVPVRLQPGKFYALPQSPQLYKQILMVSGFDKYFQIAHCFRDEDARGDRQPEFTQIDLEMSFVSQEDIFNLFEGMIKYIFKQVIEKDLKIPFKRLAYHEAIERYGTDKPDLRFGLQLQDFSEYAVAGDFQVFKSIIQDGGTIKALVVTGCANYSRKNITELEEVAKTYGAKGLAWFKVTEQDLDGGIAKFYCMQAEKIISDLKAKPGDLVLLIGDKWKTACTALGAVRSRLGADLNLTDPQVFDFCWIVDFPLFECNEEEKTWEPAHHMFSLPQDKYLDSMEKDPGAVKGYIYDLVCNGVELGSGSIRIHNPELQKRIFDIIGFSEKEAKKRFGFLLKAFEYGAPPHGGIAIGLDRFIVLLAGESSIREVMAFPKNTFGVCPMDDSPTRVDKKQLEELGIRLIGKKQE